MTTTTRTYGAHAAYLHPMTGEGVLVLPSPGDDVSPFGPVSLHAADWDAAVRDLHRLGWELSTDDDGYPLPAGVTADGREALGLYGLQPVTASPTVDELAAAWVELREAARLRV